jgi:hypothetical protein
MTAPSVIPGTEGLSAEELRLAELGARRTADSLAAYAAEFGEFWRPDLVEMLISDGRLVESGVLPPRCTWFDD